MTLSLLLDELSRDRTRTGPASTCTGAVCAHRAGARRAPEASGAQIRRLSERLRARLLHHTVTLEAIVSAHLLDVNLTTRKASEMKNCMLGSVWSKAKSYRVFFFAFKVTWPFTSSTALSVEGAYDASRYEEAQEEAVQRCGRIGDRPWQEANHFG